MKNNKEKILAISRQLFLQYGYNGISIRTIASKAKLTTGAIYFHFKNKKDIYRTICLEAIEILLNRFRESTARRENYSQKLISTFDSYLDFYYKHQDYYNILMEYKSDYDNTGGGGKEEITRKMEELLNIMAEAVRHGIEAGEFREFDPMMLSLFLAAVGEGMLQYKKLGVLSSMEIDDRDFRRFMIGVIGRGIQKKA
jgi:AcrR family transcriptional regulator